MLNIRTHTISGAEIRAKSKSGMTSEQITKELLNSPTEEVKPSQVAQLMKENAKLKAENEKLKQDTDVLVKGMETLQNKYMNECSPKLIAERDTYKMKNDKLKAENEKLKNKTLDNPQKSFDAMCKVVVELQEQIKTLKEENEKLKKMTDALDEQATDFCLQNEKLKAELKEWKGLGKTSFSDFDNVDEVSLMIDDMSENIKELKAENEKLNKMKTKRT